MQLLKKTLRPFACYSLLVLLISIPVYYFIIDFLWKNELDKHHAVVRNNIEQEINNLQLTESALQEFLATWNKIQPRTSLQTAKDGHLVSDSIYTTIRYDIHEKEIEQFRGSFSTILINNQPYHLRVETNMEEFYETLAVIIVATILFFVLLLSGLIYLNKRISLSIWQPFYIILDQLKSFELNGQHTIHFAPTAITEFEALQTDLYTLIEKNNRAFRSQKEFTENASHELQTPLALFRSQLDLLLQDTTFTSGQYQQIAALQTPVARMSRLNKNLLLLSKLENGQFPLNENVHINDTLTTIIQQLGDHLDDKRLSLKLQLEEKLAVNANSSLVEILFSNLLLNTIRHTPVEGCIHVLLTSQLVSFSNSGAVSLQSSHLFKRFSNVNKASAGSGLGLAIVKEICHHFNWAISYQFEEGMHYFIIRFQNSNYIPN